MMGPRQLIGWRGQAALAALLLLTGALAPRAARAQGDVQIFDPAPDGVWAEVWAVGEIDPLPEATRLGLERVALDACSAVDIDGSGDGPVLIVAESATLTVSTGADGAEGSTTLEQGESTVVEADQEFRLSNGMVDSAFRATALLLYPAGDEDEPLARTELDEGETVEWDEESFCAEVQGATATTLFVLGGGGEGADRLYLGTAVWEAGATTEGYAVADPTSTFNAVILSGGMGNAGVGTGRGYHAGPYRADLGPNQAIFDTLLTEPGGISSPYANTGEIPIVALIFGSATGGATIYAEAE